MYTRLIYLISFVLALSLVGNVQAQTATWTDAAPGDHLWSTPANWSEFPTPAHWAKVRNGPPGATIANEGAVASRVHVGYEEGSALTVDGGTLVISGDDLLLGKNGGSAILNMISGTINVYRDFKVGGGDPGIVNMTGGTIIVGDDFTIPESAGSTAEVNLNGGTIILDDSYSGGSSLYMTAGGTLNIGGGTLIIKPDKAWKIPGFVDDGFIIGYGGDGTVYADYDVTNPGKTTVYAIHKFNPNPVDGGLVSAGNVELSWTLPDPCVPGQPVPVDVYFTDNWEALYSFTDPEAIRIVSRNNMTSIVVQTQPKVKYYWAVDTYVGDPNDPIFGPIFSFLADYQAPQVDAGPDLLTWLADDGVRTKNLDTTVTYDKAYTVQWTVVSEPDDPNNPDAVITDPSSEDTSITLAALGEYILQLDASDGEKTGSDTVIINVYNDSCQAARSLPDYVPLVGDINGDCRVDIDDMLILLENWQKDNSLTEP